MTSRWKGYSPGILWLLLALCRPPISLAADEEIDLFTQQASRLRLWYTSVQLNGSDHGDVLVFMLGHSLMWPSHAKTGGFSLSGNIGYGVGDTAYVEVGSTGTRETSRLDLQIAAAYSYKYFYGGLGFHYIEWMEGREYDEDVSHSGAEVLVGLSLPIVESRGFWFQAQATYMPNWRWEYSGIDEVGLSAVDGDESGFGWDLGLTYRKARWWCSVGYRYVGLESTTIQLPGVAQGQGFRLDWYFRGPYAEAGLRW